MILCNTVISYRRGDVIRPYSEVTHIFVDITKIKKKQSTIVYSWLSTTAYCLLNNMLHNHRRVPTTTMTTATTTRVGLLVSIFDIPCTTVCIVVHTVVYYIIIVE